MISVSISDRPSFRSFFLLLVAVGVNLSVLAPVAKCLPAESIKSIQIDPTIYQVFGDLLSKEDYEGILREADRIIDNESATDAAKEYAFFMKIMALQSLERYVEAIGEADRCLQLFPSGTYTQTIRESRATSFNLIGVYALVDIRSEYANDAFDSVIEKVDQYLQSAFASEPAREEAEKFRIVALARLGRTDEAAESANRFLATYPESEFLSEVEEIQEETTRAIEIEARVLESSEFVLAYREALGYESIMPASVSAESGGISDPAVAAILLDHSNPRYSDSWSSDAVEEINLNIKLEAGQKRGSSTSPRYLGLQTPGPGGSYNRGEVNFELFVSEKNGERKLGDFHLDQGESGIQCFALESDLKPTGLRIKFYNDNRDIRYYSLSNLYLLGEDRTAVIAERDDVNMLRTSIPEFEIGERVIPISSEVFPVHRSMARVEREDISQLFYMFGNLLVGITDDENILLVDATTGEIETEITTSFYEVLDIIPDRRGRRVYFRYVDEERDRRFCQLNPSNWRITYDLGLPQEPEPHSIYFADDTGEALVVYPDDIELRSAGLGEVKWRKPDTGRLLYGSLHRGYQPGNRGKGYCKEMGAGGR